MKILEPELQAHLDEGTTTLCWCWRIIRTDGATFGFTDHDMALFFDGTEFEPDSGFIASEIRAGSDLSVDAQDAEGVLSSNRITETDIIDGQWDAAEVEVWRVNWQEPDQRVLLRRGAVGQVRRGKTIFVAEIRSLAHHLDQSVGRVYQSTCDAELGDHRCKVDLDVPAFRGTGTVVSQDGDRAFTASGLADFADGLFAAGTLLWTSGESSGRRAEVRWHAKQGDTVSITLLEEPVRAIAPRDVFIIHAGCDKRLAVFRSPSNEGYSHVINWSGRATIGTLVDDFYGAPSDRFDHGNILTVDLSPGGQAPQSVSDLALFEGANAFAVQSSPGASSSGFWEIVQASEVELIAPGRYQMRRLLRGQRGTESAIGDPTPAGARVVMLNSALAPLPIPAADLGLPYSWLVGPASHPHSHDSYVEQQFTPIGVGLRPFSPVHITQPWRFAREPGDLEIAWIRRDRALAADSWHGIEIPMSETEEAYEVDILDPGEAGSTVLRTLATETTSVIYSGARQMEDWGKLLGPDDTLDIAVYQLSATYGRGAANRTTLYF